MAPRTRRTRRTGVLSPAAFLRRRALYSGLFGGSQAWMAIGALVWGPRFVNRLLGRNERIVATEVLKPGESVYLRALEPLTRAQRRAARRAR